MTRRAEGFFRQGEEELTPAPRLRIGVGFGPGRIAAFTAVLDTGSDLCVFPVEAFEKMGLDEPPAFREVRGFDGTSSEAPAYYPSITAGDLRERGVEAILLPGVEPLVGRNFLNRFRVLLDSSEDLVTVEIPE